MTFRTDRSRMPASARARGAAAALVLLLAGCASSTDASGGQAPSASPAASASPTATTSTDTSGGQAPSASPAASASQHPPAPPHQPAPPHRPARARPPAGRPAPRLACRPVRLPPEGRPPTRSEPPSDVTVEVGLADGKVTTGVQNVKVERGQSVLLRGSSDVGDSLHVHGYDESIYLQPGEPAELTFTADVTGVFEIETHKPSRRSPSSRCRDTSHAGSCSARTRAASPTSTHCSRPAQPGALGAPSVRGRPAVGDSSPKRHLAAPDLGLVTVAEPHQPGPDVSVLPLSHRVDSGSSRSPGVAKQGALGAAPARCARSGCGGRGASSCAGASRPAVDAPGDHRRPSCRVPPGRAGTGCGSLRAAAVGKVGYPGGAGRQRQLWFRPKR